MVPNIEKLIEQYRPDFYLCQNSEYSRIKLIEDYKGFHVIRDPRDIIVSGYFSHLYSHSTDGWYDLLKHRKALQMVEKDQGLLLEMEFSKIFVDHIAEWNYDDQNIYEVKMEALISDPGSELAKILGFLGLLDDSEQSRILPGAWIGVYNRVARKINVKARKDHKINKTTLDKILKRHSFNKLAKGRVKSQEDIRSHYRKGVSEDWRNHFKEVHIQRFQELFPGIIEKLGYQQW